VSYVDDVAARLRDLPRPTRAAALQDLRDLLAEGMDPAELGTPDEYAAVLRGGAPGSTDRPAARILGVPVEFRGATDSAVRSRIFDPSDSRVLVPRLLGLGWTVNLGAVAVRLGLLRPDDVDADVVAHIPPRVTAATRAVPWALAGVTALGVGAAWRTGERVPSHWGLTGRVDRWSDRRAALLPLVTGAVGAAWWASRAAPPEDRLVRTAVGAWVAGLTAKMAAVTALSARRPEAAHPGIALLGVTPTLAAAALLIVPVRAGLRAIGRGGDPAASGKDIP